MKTKLPKQGPLAVGKHMNATEVEHTTLSDDSAEMLYHLAYELYRNGKYSDAEDCFKLLTGHRLEDRKLWMGLGASYQMQNKHEEALECYSIAAIQDPNDPYVHWYAAQCLFSQNNLPKALEALKSARVVAKANPHFANTAVTIEHLESIWTQGALP